METKETLAQEALRLLTSIPKEDFIVNSFTDGIGKCCAIGHIQRLKSKNAKIYTPHNCNDYFVYEGCIRQISEEFLFKEHSLIGRDISNVNNTTMVNGYNEPEIKDRVMHLLSDMVTVGL
jgi:hypothetical protein